MRTAAGSGVAYFLSAFEFKRAIVERARDKE